MLPRKKLVPLRSEFGVISKASKQYDSPSFRLMVHFRKQKDSEEKVRFAFVVNKKVDRRSVVRHDVKRKFSDAADELTKRIVPAVDLVILAKPESAKKEPEAIKNELESIFKRAQLIL